MSKILQQKIDELFQATKELRSFEEIKPYCEQFNEWVNTHTNYSSGSLGTVLSRYGFYKKFKSLPLEQGKNADSIPKHDANGNVIGTELKHYVLLLCGLDQDKWKERNETTRVIDRLGNDQEVDPDKYLEVTGRLLLSLDPHELAVGLIAATGRRPHEILARAKFTSLEGESYQLMFEGQGKKRGEKPSFKIATLYPAEYIIMSLTRLRREPSTKALLQEVANEFPNDLAAQNRSIDNRRNGSLNRVVRAYFGDKGDSSPVLAFRHAEEQDNNKALRAAYGALATKRDCDRSVGKQMLYYARLLGHFVKENPTDKELQAIATSIGYADYYVTKPVEFPSAPQKEKTAQVRVSDSDFDQIKQFQQEWELPNQQAVIKRLIESHQQKLGVAKELLEALAQVAQLEKHVLQLQDQNNQLSKEKTEMEKSEPPKQITINETELEAYLERMVFEKLKQALANSTQIQTQPQTLPQPEQAVTPMPIPTPVVPRNMPTVKEIIDWETKSNAELWGTKASGAATEKIRRSYEAICLYNDTLATGDNDRLAITNLALRELSGVNGLLVGDWIKSHADEIISYNSKHGMQNSKDHTKVETYYNKRLGQDKILEILHLVNEKFLDAVASKFKPAQSVR